MLMHVLRPVLSVLIGGVVYSMVQLMATVYMPIAIAGRLLGRPETWFDKLTITLYNEHIWSYAIAAIVAIIFFLLTPPLKAASK